MSTVAASARDLRQGLVAPSAPVTLAKWADYFIVASTRRFRASQRRRVFDAALLGMAIVAAVAFLNCATLTLVHPHALRTVVAMNVGLAGTALLAHMAVSRLGRRYGEAAVWVITAAVVTSTVALGLLEPELSLLAAGYLLILPMVIALIVPWRTRTHVMWLGLLASVTVAYLAGAPPSALQPYEREDLAVLLGVVVLVSQLGHVLGLRAQVRVFTQAAHIARLRRAEHANLVALEGLNRSLAVTARTDELTGLGNRLHFVEDLAATRAAVERYAETYGLFELDLDAFKRINDTLGHPGGDEILQAVASALSATLRGSDAAYRYGGEEFIVIARVTTDALSIALAERLRGAVESLAIAHPDNPASPFVTVSVGATRIDREDLADDNASWLARVDRALYEAKAGGRNCVRFSARPKHDPSTLLEQDGPAGPFALAAADGPTASRARARRT